MAPHQRHHSTQTTHQFAAPLRSQRSSRASSGAARARTNQLLLSTQPLGASSTGSASSSSSSSSSAAASGREEDTYIGPSNSMRLCRYFVSGGCRFGSRCRFAHVKSESHKEETMASSSLAIQQQEEECMYFRAGHCRFGDFCRWKHTVGEQTEEEQDESMDNNDENKPSAADSSIQEKYNSSNNQPTPPPSPPANEQETTCGICFEDVVKSHKRFGLLACDHCFCIDCLGEWRRSKEMDAEVIQSCPVCRMKCSYVVPSCRFVTGKAKEQVIANYKQQLAQRECRYFTGRPGSCRYGRDCLYAHLDARGQDIKDQDLPMAERRSRPTRRTTGFDNFGMNLRQLLDTFVDEFEDPELGFFDRLQSTLDYEIGLEGDEDEEEEGGGFGFEDYAGYLTREAYRALTSATSYEYEEEMEEEYEDEFFLVC